MFECYTIIAKNKLIYGSYLSLEDAKIHCPPGFSIFDSNWNKVYTAKLPDEKMLEENYEILCKKIMGR